MEAIANFVPKLGLAKVYPINDEERTFAQIVAKAKVVFDEAVERNFIKRRPLVEIYLEPRDPQNGQSCLKVFFKASLNARCMPSHCRVFRLSSISKLCEPLLQSEGSTATAFSYPMIQSLTFTTRFLKKIY